MELEGVAVERIYNDFRSLHKPKLVLLVGVPAQDTLNRHFRGENAEIQFADVRHPSHGGAQEFASQLRDAIRVAGV